MWRGGGGWKEGTVQSYLCAKHEESVRLVKNMITCQRLVQACTSSERVPLVDSTLARYR